MESMIERNMRTHHTRLRIIVVEELLKCVIRMAGVLAFVLRPVGPA